MMESAGRHMPLLAAGGVLLVEASKQVSSPVRGHLAEAVRRPILVPNGVPAPAGRVPPG
jgi:hypothetical protein